MNRPDDELDALIERALRAQAETIRPQDLTHVDPPTAVRPHRRPHRVWPPLLAAAAVAAIAVGFGLAASSGGGDAAPGEPGTSTASTGSTPSPSPSAPPSPRPSATASSSASAPSAASSSTRSTPEQSAPRTSGLRSSPAADPHTVTFSGVGPLHLGMSRTAVEALGYAAHLGSSGCVLLNAQGRPSAVLQPGAGVVAINTFPLAGYRTEVGIHVGSTLAQVRASYPASIREEHLNGDFGQGGDGILVHGDGGWLGLTITDGAVSSITVGTHDHASALESGC